MTSQVISAERDMWRISDVWITDYMRSMRMNIKYEEFFLREQISFPEKILIELRERNNSIHLDMKYGMVVFDEKINAKFIVPENYHRIMM